MIVTKPSSGDTITHASVEAMHAAVLVLANAMGESELSHGTLRHDQLMTLLEDYDVNNTDTQVLVNTDGLNESALDIAASWQLFAAWQFAWDTGLGGAGKTLPPCHLIMFASIEPGVLSAANGIYDWWLFNLYHSKDGAEVIDEHNTRIVTSHSTYDSVTDAVTIVAYYDYSSEPGDWDLDYIRVKGCKIRAGAAGAAPNLAIPRGTVGFIALYRS